MTTTGGRRPPFAEGGPEGPSKLREELNRNGPHPGSQEAREWTAAERAEHERCKRFKRAVRCDPDVPLWMKPFAFAVADAVDYQTGIAVITDQRLMIEVRPSNKDQCLKMRDRIEELGYWRVKRGCRGKASEYEIGDERIDAVLEWRGAKHEAEKAEAAEKAKTDKRHGNKGRPPRPKSSPEATVSEPAGGNINSRDQRTRIYPEDSPPDKFNSRDQRTTIYGEDAMPKNSTAEISAKTVNSTAEISGPSLLEDTSQDKAPPISEANSELSYPLHPREAASPAPAAPHAQEPALEKRGQPEPATAAPSDQEPASVGSAAAREPVQTLRPPRDRREWTWWGSLIRACEHAEFLTFEQSRVLWDRLGGIPEGERPKVRAATRPSGTVWRWLLGRDALVAMRGGLMTDAEVDRQLGRLPPPPLTITRVAANGTVEVFRSPNDRAELPFASREEVRDWLASAPQPVDAGHQGEPEEAPAAMPVPAAAPVKAMPGGLVGASIEELKARAEVWEQHRREILKLRDMGLAEDHVQRALRNLGPPPFIVAGFGPGSEVAGHA